ncbi:hypothetical protein [Palleronia sp.]|uniref:hypothetical protein n=1 Tax=Palleronia sp. TaxID=1940284 RepID=UPI0035C83B36
MTETSADTATMAAAARPSKLRIPFGRRGFILSAMAVAAAGFWLNWGWLTAIGAAPLILSLAPCAVMCGLGICCMKSGSKSCGSKSNPAGEPDLPRD